MKKISNQNVCIILFIVLGVTVTQASAEVFTVDGNGGGNFTSIQNAVDNAHSGDTIMVNPGVYRENIAVNKEVTILSNPALTSTNRTYVIGAVPGNDVLGIFSNNVKVDGLYIIGGPSGVERDETGINLNGVENCSLSNNGLVLNDAGISLNGCRNNYLDGNLISLGKKGITLVNSNENILSNNTVTTNSNGLTLNNSVNNTLIGNIADANLIGVYLGASQGNVFNYNVIMRNINGINGEAAKSNFVVNNTVYLNEVGINLTGSSGNSFYENSFSNFLDVLDDGKNVWNSSSKGNFWQNYTGQDADGNGIGDTPYAIDQATGSIDYMPLLSIGRMENVSVNVSKYTSNVTYENESKITGI